MPKEIKNQSPVVLVMFEKNDSLKLAPKMAETKIENKYINKTQNTLERKIPISDLRLNKETPMPTAKIEETSIKFIDLVTDPKYRNEV